MVEETFEPGMTVSLVARRHDVAPNQLFTWRRLAAQGSLTAAGSGEEVVPASDYRALQNQVFVSFIGSLARRPWKPRFSRRLSNTPRDQKKRLRLPPLSPRTWSRSRPGQTRGRRGNARQDPVCNQWVAILRSWPVRQLESGISLSDEQRAILYDLTAAICRAIRGLVEVCPAGDHFTALGRLDPRQRQLQALRDGIDAIQPLLSKFEDSLNDSQRPRLAMAGRLKLKAKLASPEQVRQPCSVSVHLSLVSINISNLLREKKCAWSSSRHGRTRS
jgi:transposase-like protein